MAIEKEKPGFAKNRVLLFGSYLRNSKPADIHRRN
jgi:hypothetical protein